LPSGAVSRLLLVGHVTKEGTIAGPRVLEHMVDTVLHFEGERSHQFRILRAVKNRFGPADEIGVFEMSDSGLERGRRTRRTLFLGEREGDVSGAAVFAGIEGSRPVLVEIQALVAPSALATPRRAVIGWDSGRLAMVMAVLDTRCGLGLGPLDVYLNVAGGLKISEPAADLAVAAALLSSESGDAIPEPGPLCSAKSACPAKYDPYRGLMHAEAKRRNWVSRTRIVPKLGCRSRVTKRRDYGMTPSSKSASTRPARRPLATAHGQTPAGDGIGTVMDVPQQPSDQYRRYRRSVDFGGLGGPGLCPRVRARGACPSAAGSARSSRPFMVFPYAKPRWPGSTSTSRRRRRF
jgi:hypothetical protein